MHESRDQERRVRLVTEIFDKHRSLGKTEPEIFGEAAESLKQLARQMTRRLHAGDSLTANRLFADAYVKLFEQPATEFRWDTGDEFFLAVARAMHDLKVDYIRRKMAAKRGAGKVDSLDDLRVEEIHESGLPINKNLFETQAVQAFEIDEALRKLREEYPDREKAIVLTYWDGGLTREEAAEALKVSPDKVKKDLEKGRARIRHYLNVGEV